MTGPEKLTALKNIVDERDEEVLSTYLSLAASAVLEKCYPYNQYNPEICEVPRKYGMTQVKIASYLLHKRGAEGQTTHNEGGINRSYGSADIPDDMLKGIVPHARVLGGKK